MCSMTFITFDHSIHFVSMIKSAYLQRGYLCICEPLQDIVEIHLILRYRDQRFLTIDIHQMNIVQFGHIKDNKSSCLLLYVLDA